ncbi:UNVERIFIED_CONTAM: hypothetical protein Slati_1744700 [Sesamum latifolium]|uniref:GATA-type domain-containing protein n=1 Tax=Sesamum latifolium TaxID=2727402 RepID=A0AAW2WXK7_9LAMI
MVFDAAGPVLWSSTYNQNGAPDDGTRSCPLDAGPSSYYYGGGPYDYMSGLADRFHNVVHAVEQSLWNCCTTSQLGVLAELVDIKFCGEARYKPSRESNPNRTKTSYVILRYLLISTRLQRLYVSKATAEQMTWHAIHEMEEESMCHPSDTEAWRHFDPTHPNFAAEPLNVRLSLGTEGTKDETFTIRAALMWTVNDLSAYGMAIGWSTAGVMGCPVCMEDTRGFYLQNDRKACCFDCHRQFLPPDHPYRRNKKAFTKNRVERKVAHPRLTG